MDVQIGLYRNTSYSFVPNTRVITILGFPYKFDSSVIKLVANVTGLNNSGIGYVIAHPLAYNGQNTNPIYTSPGIIPTLSATSGGAVTLGLHDWVYTYVFNTGDESLPSLSSTGITVASGFQTVQVTVTTGNTLTVARNIYRRIAGMTGSYLYVGQLSDNSSVTFLDNVADSTITTSNIPAPIISGAYDITFKTTYPLLNVNDVLFIRCEVPDETRDDDLNINRNINLDAAELPPADPEVATASDTNLAISTYFYEIPQGSWRNFNAQIKATCTLQSSVIKVLATLDNTAAVPATNGVPSVDWVDITSTVYNSQQIIIPISGTYISQITNWSVDNFGKQVMYDRFLVQYTVLSATNFLQITVRKF